MTLLFIMALVSFMLLLEFISLYKKSPSEIKTAEADAFNPMGNFPFRIITEQEVMLFNKKNPSSFMCKNCSITKNSLEVIRQYCEGCCCFLCHNCSGELCGECNQKKNENL